MATIAGANNNPVARKNVYPASSGPTIGGAASTLSPFDTSAMMSGSASVGANGGTASASDVASAQTAASRGFMGQPMTWFLLLLALLIGMRFVGSKLGDSDDFKNIRVTVHNVILISLASIIGISFFKVLFSYFKIPGLSNLVAAV